MKAKSTWVTFLVLLFVGASFFLLPSCDKLKEATTFKFKVDLPESRYTLGASSLLKAEKVLFSQSSTINIDSIVGTRDGLLERVSFYKLRFSIVSPESAKINWLTSARITISTDGGVPVEIASSPTILATDRTIEFQVKDIDIYSTIKKPFLLTVYGNLNGNTPALPMEMLLESGIEITLSPF